MAVTVETLDKLERRMTLTLPAAQIRGEIESRLRRLARTVKADGFRPGKVPLSVVSQRYGYSVQSEVMNDKVGKAFSDAASQAQLRVAGAPRITEREPAANDEMAFDATFEVYPEVQLGDLAGVQIERIAVDVDDAAIDKTIGILRNQRRTYSERAQGEPAVEGDRVTIDFAGTIDGVPFDGGKALGFQFVIGEGQMLDTFDQAVRGMKPGESKTFPLQFPDDYQGKDVAGREADFMVTVKRIEQQHLPEVDAAFAESLGIADATVDGLRADVRRNLEREVKFRVLARNKGAVMEALIGVAELDVPKALVNSEIERMIENARADMRKRGAKDVDRLQIPPEVFQPQAERRVKLGLTVAELVRANALQAQPAQLQAHIEEMAQSYEKPADVVRWYLTDRQRMAEVEAVVVENNVVDHVLSKAQVVEKTVPFEELMSTAS